ncbi:MAG: hypothetical protein LBL79_00755 [Prevotella sp.]|jgi:hypothetical protein|nr:hypothetical protein [Prevotella sp.]
MADFDNGLPPQGTDVSANGINSVLICKSEVSADDAFNVSSVVMEKKDVTDSPLSRIAGVLLEQEEAGYRNRNMFL